MTHTSPLCPLLYRYTSEKPCHSKVTCPTPQRVASPYDSKKQITVSQKPRMGKPIFSASATSSPIETASC